MSDPLTADELAETQQLANAAATMARYSAISYQAALRLLAEAGEYVKARAEVERLRAQLAAVRAVVAESQRIELTVSSNRDLLAALDG